MPTRKQAPTRHGRVVSVRLDDTLIAQLDELAERTGRSRSVYIKRALEISLPQLEREYGQQVLDLVSTQRQLAPEQNRGTVPELPIPRADVAATLRAYDPSTTPDDIDLLLKQMQAMFTRLVNHNGYSHQAAEQAVRAMQLDEYTAAITEQDSRTPVRKATEEEVAGITIADALNGADCDSYEEYEQRYRDWL